MLLVFSLPAESAVMTVLDMEEMSQIAGGSTRCKEIRSTGGGSVGNCRPNGSFCRHGLDCGTNPYTIIYGSEYCAAVPSGGYYDCWCSTVSPGWKMYNCQICILLNCIALSRGTGGSRVDCTAGGGGACN